MKKKISLKNLIFMLLVSVNLLLIIGLILVVKRTMFVQAELKEFNAKTEEMQFSKKKVRNFSMEKYEKEKAEVKKLAGDNGVPLEAIKEIASLAKSVGLNNVQVSVVEDSKDDQILIKGISTFKLEMKFSAEYKKIINFLEEIKNLNYLVNPSKVIISRDNSKLPSLQAKVKLDVFSSSPKQSKGKLKDSAREADTNQP